MILLLDWDHWCGCVIKLVTTADDRLNVLYRFENFTGRTRVLTKLWWLKSAANAAKFGTHLVTTFFFLDLALQTLFRVSLNWWWLSAKKYFPHENILFSNFIQVIFYTHHKVCDQISAKRRDYIIKCVCVHILQHSIKWDGYTCGLFVINIH